MKSELYCGDCLEILPTLPISSVDMVFADVPYGTTSCAWDAVIPFDPMWRELRRVCKHNAPMVFTASQPFTSALVMSNPKRLRDEWIWNKSHSSGFLSADRHPLRRHESVLMFCYGTLYTYNPQMNTGPLVKKRIGDRDTERRQDTVYGGKPANLSMVASDQYYPTTDLYFQCVRRGDSIHSTQKPAEMVEYFIRTYSDPGAVILDFCMGSGTTGEACASVRDRDFVGIERDPEIFSKAKRRIETAEIIYRGLPRRA